MHTWSPLRLKGALLYPREEPLIRKRHGQAETHQQHWPTWGLTLSHIGAAIDMSHVAAGVRVFQRNAERGKSHGHAFIWMHVAAKMHTGTKLLVGFSLLPAPCCSLGCLPLNLSPCVPCPSLSHPHMLPLTAFTLTFSLCLPLLHIKTFLASWFSLHRLSTLTWRSPRFTSGRVYCHS